MSTETNGVNNVPEAPKDSRMYIGGHTKCPNCKTQMPFRIGIDTQDIRMYAPTIRAGANYSPDGLIFVYKITSNHIRDFLIEKTHEYVSDAKVVSVPIYCENKRKRQDGHHNSYSTIRVAFSKEVSLNPRDRDDWFVNIGTGDGRVQVNRDLFNHVMSPYKYDQRFYNDPLKDYDKMSELEDHHGITEKFLKDLKMYAIPRWVKAAGGEEWIFFSAAPEFIIVDMLTDVTTGKPIGKIVVEDEYLINKDTVEYLVYVHVNEFERKISEHVRAIMLGEEKAK